MQLWHRLKLCSRKSQKLHLHKVEHCTFGAYPSPSFGALAAVGSNASYNNNKSIVQLLLCVVLYVRSAAHIPGGTVSEQRVYKISGWRYSNCPPPMQLPRPPEAGVLGAASLVRLAAADSVGLLVGCGRLPAPRHAFPRGLLLR